MTGLHYQNGELTIDGVALSQIADAHGTPVYVYTAAKIQNQCRDLKRALGNPEKAMAFYATKALTNRTILALIEKEGIGAEVVSLGELQRALAAGFPPSRIVFTGVGKQAHEIRFALEKGIFAFIVESADELKLLSGLAPNEKPARIALRLNPDIDAKTHPYIATGLYTTKFGISEAELPAIGPLLKSPTLKLVGLTCHLGSQITDTSPYDDAIARLLHHATTTFRDSSIEFIDIGGGFAIPYKDETVPSFESYLKSVLHKLESTPYKLAVEPGRTLVGEAGILLATVVSTKRTPRKTFAIVDAGMNDLIRPTLYEAHHPIRTVKESKGPLAPVDVVGPICETGDFLALDRKLPPLNPGDRIAILNAGAYGMSMASQYNSRGRAAEVLVENGKFRLIGRRETLEDIIRTECS